LAEQAQEITDAWLATYNAYLFEDLFTERAIEPLDEGVLIGLPGLNIADEHAMRSASSPGSEGVAVPDPTVSSL